MARQESARAIASANRTGSRQLSVCSDFPIFLPLWTAPKTSSATAIFLIFLTYIFYGAVKLDDMHENSWEMNLCGVSVCNELASTE